LLERSEVAIIIPAFNESATITCVVNSLLSYGIVIVVDDCSSDGTGLLAEGAGAVVVRHNSNQGYDGALNSGFIEAQSRSCSYVVTFDADGQHNHELIELYITKLRQGYDLVLGMRPDYARLAERIFSLYTKIKFGLHDPLCGMKGYRMELFHEQGWFDSYQSIGTELAFYAVSHNKAFTQIDIPIAPREGNPRFGQRWKANYKIFRAMILSIRHVSSYK